MEPRALVWENLALSLPPGWDDSTRELTDGDGPLTLSRDKDDKGVLQISASEPLENPTPQALFELIEEFAAGHDLGAATDVQQEPGPPIVAAATYRTREDFIRVWYVSDGANVALATYVAAPSGYESELGEADRIVRSLRFT